MGPVRGDRWLGGWWIGQVLGDRLGAGDRRSGARIARAGEQEGEEERRAGHGGRMVRRTTAAGKRRIAPSRTREVARVTKGR